LEEKKVRRGKRGHREIKEENRIHIDYKRIKISLIILLFIKKTIIYLKTF